MKATGIVRTIDDLGRVVIPKEIRRNLNIRDGQPLEIYTQPDGQIILKKHSGSSGFEELSRHLAQSVRRVTGLGVIVGAADGIIAVTGAESAAPGDAVGGALARVLESGNAARSSEVEDETLTGSPDDGLYPYYAVPAMKDAKVVGVLAVAAPEGDGSLDAGAERACETAAAALAAMWVE